MNKKNNVKYIYYFSMLEIKIILHFNIFYSKKMFLLHLIIFMIKIFKIYKLKNTIYFINIFLVIFLTTNLIL